MEPLTLLCTKEIKKLNIVVRVIEEVIYALLPQI